MSAEYSSKFQARMIELQEEDKPMLNADRVYEAIKVWQDAEDDASLASMFKAFIRQIRVFPKTIEIDFFLDINGRKYIMKQKKRPV